jgi:hypothetical protein
MANDLRQSFIALRVTSSFVRRQGAKNADPDEATRWKGFTWDYVN